MRPFYYTALLLQGVFHSLRGTANKGTTELSRDAKLKHFFGNLTSDMIDRLYQLYKKVRIEGQHRLHRIGFLGRQPEHNLSYLLHTTYINVFAFLQDFEMFGYEYNASYYHELARK